MGRTYMSFKAFSKMQRLLLIKFMDGEIMIAGYAIDRNTERIPEFMEPFQCLRLKLFEALVDYVSSDNDELDLFIFLRLLNDDIFY